MTNLEQFSHIKWSEYDSTNELLIAWHGGHGIHAYDSEGNEVAFWNVGSFAENSLTLEEAQETISESIETQDYLNY